MKISAVKTAYAILVLTGTVYAFFALQGPGGLPGLLEKRRLVHEYEVTNQQLHREIEQKQQRLVRLRENPAEQEMEIRQKLKLARPGEKIFILDQKK